MKKILIIGGSGFLGGHLISQAKTKYRVTTTYYKHKYQITRINWKFLDLTQIATLEPLIRGAQPETIIHTAAITSVDECERQHELANLINVQATKEIAAISSKNNIRLIFISSDMVYDGTKGNYNEEDKVNPINYYGRTKVMAEEEIKEYCSNYVVVRVALIYGNAITNSNSFSEKILYNIKNNQMVNLFYDQFRTPILVDNLTEALLELVETPFIGTLNFGGSQRISRYDFGLEMAKLYDLPLKYLRRCSMNDVITIAKRPQDISLNISKSQALLSTKFLNCKEGLTVSRATSHRQ